MLHLLHYIPDRMLFDESACATYREVNQIFANAISPQIQDNDLIWIHDYHLMLLPKLLRNAIGDQKKGYRIGFSLHTPFPSNDSFTILPMRDDVLNGLMACDLVGLIPKNTPTTSRTVLGDGATIYILLQGLLTHPGNTEARQGLD